MVAPQRADWSEAISTAQQQIARLAQLPAVRSIFAWFRSQESQFASWQLELARIPAPPFGESARGEWLEDRFRELGLDYVHTDEVGNVFGVFPKPGDQYVSLSAHIDTVFPAGTPLNVRQQDSRLYGPGVSDNGAGITALLAVAAAVRAARLSTAMPIVFIANVGEETTGAVCACSERLCTN
jgi:acetylornithine deacetylase/succinyl-diaminopimelate desuccinylase-like protein